MKKLLFCLFLMLSGFTGFSQYNDTLYYKSGFARPVTVREYDDHYLWYEYRNKKGKLVETKIGTSTLTHFVIYNEYGELIYNSKTGYRKETSTEIQEE